MENNQRTRHLATTYSPKVHGQYPSYRMRWFEHTVGDLYRGLASTLLSCPLPLGPPHFSTSQSRSNSSSSRTLTQFVTPNSFSVSADFPGTSRPWSSTRRYGPPSTRMRWSTSRTATGPRDLRQRLVWLIKLVGANVSTLKIRPWRLGGA